MKINELHKIWKNRIDEFKKSNEPRKTWCEKRNINIKTFGKWYVKLEKENNKKTASKFIEINQNISMSNSEINLNHKTSSSILIQIGKATIEIKKGFNKCLLQDVIKTIGEIC